MYTCIIGMLIVHIVYYLYASDFLCFGLFYHELIYPEFLVVYRIVIGHKAILF